MSSERPPEPPSARSRLIGRLMVVGMLILVLIYLVPLFISRFAH